MTDEQIGATLEESFPHISASLTALSNTADAWYDVPGIDGLTRVSQGKPVRTVPGLRKYYRDDLVPRIVAQRKNVQRLAGSGGVGYIPYLLLVVGLGLLALGAAEVTARGQAGARQALVGTRRRCRRRAHPARRDCAVLPAAGRSAAGDDGPRAGCHPGARAGGAERDGHDPRGDRLRRSADDREAVAQHARAPRLYRFIADADRAVEPARAPRGRAPCAALDGAARRGAADGGRGRERAPRAAICRTCFGSRATGSPTRCASVRRPHPALLTLPEVAASWGAIGPAGMTRFDGVTPVRSMAEFDDYLRQDLVPVLNYRARGLRHASRAAGRRSTRSHRPC